MAGGIDWFRWHHGSVTDPKFLVVSRKAGVRLGDVLAVWAFLLEKASAAEKRGTFGDIDGEAVDCLLDMDEGATDRIIAAMQGRSLVDDGAISAWDKRQPKRERDDPNAAERKAIQRDRESRQQEPSVATQSNVTPCHATSHQEKPILEESRGDISLPIGSDGAQDAPAKPKRGARLAQDWVLPQAWGQWALDKYPHFTADIVRDEALKFANHWHAAAGKSATKLDWYGTWQNWCMSDICQRAHPPPGQNTEGAYARQMRERVEEAAGSLAHVVAAKQPGQIKRPPWEQAIENEHRTLAIGMGGRDFLEADGPVRA